MHHVLILISIHNKGGVFYFFNREGWPVTEILSYTSCALENFWIFYIFFFSFYIFLISLFVNIPGKFVWVLLFLFDCCLSYKNVKNKIWKKQTLEAPFRTMLWNRVLLKERAICEVRVTLVAIIWSYKLRVQSNKGLSEILFNTSFFFRASDNLISSVDVSCVITGILRSFTADIPDFSSSNIKHSVFLSLPTNFQCRCSVSLQRLKGGIYRGNGI